MTSLAAVVQDTTPPRVQVTATDVPVAPGTATLYRVADGQRVAVRGMLATPTTAAVFVVNDYEAPFGVPLTYVLALAYTDGTTEEVESGPVTVEAASAWVSHPITGQGVALTIADWPEFTYTSRQTVVPVAGRAAPIVVSDVRLAASSSLVLLTRTREDLAALRGLLDTGDVLHVRAPCPAVEEAYVAVGDVVETRVKPTSRDLDPKPAGADWRRLLTLTVQAVDRPTPGIAAYVDTLADLAAYVPGTLADLADAFGPDATLLTIATTNLSGGGNA